MDTLTNLRECAEAAVDAWDEYEKGKLARLIVQARMVELSEMLAELDRDQSLSNEQIRAGSGAVQL